MLVFPQEGLRVTAALSGLWSSQVIPCSNAVLEPAELPRTTCLGPPVFKRHNVPLQDPVYKPINPTPGAAAISFASSIAGEQASLVLSRPPCVDLLRLGCSGLSALIKLASQGEVGSNNVSLLSPVNTYPARGIDPR